MLPRALFTQSAWWLMIKEYWDLYCLGSKATLTIKTNNNMNTLNERSIVVGVDVHKYSHTAVAMNAWGEEKGKIDFTNNNLETYTQWLEQMGLKENIIYQEPASLSNSPILHRKLPRALSTVVQQKSD